MTDESGKPRNGPILGRVNRLVWPVSPGLAIAASGVLTVVLLTTLSGMLRWYPAAWYQFSYGFRESTWLAVPLVAALGGYFGDQFRPTSLTFGTTSGRGQAAMSQRLVAGLTVVVATSVLVTFATAAAVAYVRGTSDNLPVVDLLSSATAVWAAAPLGVFLGSRAPSGAWPFAAPLGATILFLIPSLIEYTLFSTGHTATIISLNWGLRLPDAGFPLSLHVGIIRVAYFLLLGLVATHLVPRASDGISRLGRAAPALLLPSVALSVIALSPRLELVERAVEEPWCQEVNGVRLCLTREHELLGQDLVRSIEPMTRIAPGSDVALVESALSSTVSDTRIPQPWHFATKDAYLQAVVYSLADTLAFEDSCDALSDDVDEGEPAGQHARTENYLVRNRLVAATGLPFRVVGILEESGEPVQDDVLGGLAVLSDAEFGQWYGEHLEEIRACRIEIPDL